MMIRAILVTTILASFVWADAINLKSGRTVQGAYLGGDSRNVRIAVADRVETFDVSDISEIRFGSAPAAPVPALAPPARQRTEILQPERAIPAPRPAATTQSAELPSGSQIVVRMIDDVDSEVNRVGQTFRASVDEPVTVNGEALIPRGADVVVKLVEDKQSGKLSGKTELTLDLVSVQANGRMVDVLTQEVTQASSSQTARTGKVVGGTAALGAIIGAIAGGGKGAAIGAVSGAGAGAAIQVMTKGQRVRIPSETRLSFTLQQPVRI